MASRSTLLCFSIREKFANCGRLFLVFVNTISRLPFLRTLSKTANAEMAKQSVEFKAEDDLDLGIYYLRTLSNVFRWAPDAFWGVLATRLIEDQGPNLAEISEWIATHCAWSRTNT